MHLISLSVDNSETFASLIKHVAIDVWCSTSANLNSLNNPQVYVIAHLKGTLMSPSQFSYIRVANYFFIFKLQIHMWLFQPSHWRESLSLRTASNKYGKIILILFS